MSSTMPLGGPMRAGRFDVERFVSQVIDSFEQQSSLPLAQDARYAVIEDLAQLLTLRRKLGTTPTTLTGGTRTVLRELADPAARDALLALPAKLAAQARCARRPSTRRRLTLRTAVAIELLLHTGMRLQQLARLRIGEHVTWPDGPHGALRIEAPGGRTRDGAPLQFEFSGAPQALVQEHTREFASQVAPQRHPYLFASRSGKPVTAAALADGIAKATSRGIGIRITPHDFRHICAMLILDANRDDYATVKDLLGHQFLVSTLAYYGDRQQQTARQQWNTVLAPPRAQATPEQARHAQDA